MSLRHIKLTVGSTPFKTAYTWSYPNSDGKTYVVPTYQLTVNGHDEFSAPKAFIALQATQSLTSWESKVISGS